MAYIDDAISGSAYDDAANLLSVRIIVFAAHHCAELQCGARQNKTPTDDSGLL